MNAFYLSYELHNYLPEDEAEMVQTINWSSSQIHIHYICALNGYNTRIPYLVPSHIVQKDIRDSATDTWPVVF